MAKKSRQKRRDRTNRAKKPDEATDELAVGSSASYNNAVDQAQIRTRLDALRIEHRDLDAAIAALSMLPIPDQLAIARSKKRKLRLRDEMSMLEDRLIPDIIA